ncbi:dihydrodipicolinate synthase family protein [Aureimonas sp. N4]|uniref:dihydrodipicolinate synthase family protein n=1 Tax=Aureimonas sp. N4 TaxID=1638165 RepID=UPI000786397B|nr:dihydrodipicolinate synthase family protein [Aureimonas sp. N4]
MTDLQLPTEGRGVETYRLTGTPLPLTHRRAEDFNRVAYAAAHVVADPLVPSDPWLEPAIDWDATLRFRHRLWDLGLGVAEAMDTAQRGMGLGWPDAQELIRRSLREARSRDDALIACGAGTDHLAPDPFLTLDRIASAYAEQTAFVEGEGGRVILMASRALAASAKGPDDYLEVYARVLSGVDQPVIIHWLGEMFDPALSGYWGAADHDAAMDTCLRMIEANAAKIDGIKISLLSKEKEITMRRRLPEGVRMYTGDDFNYAELIAGDEAGHSDALLGIFDAIAPAASAALASLKRGSTNEFHDILEPTVALSRHIFRAPTRFYKTGVVFLAWLNGLQDHFTMVGGQESARSTLHFAELFRLADRANVLADPDEAARRMGQFLAVRGIAP